MPVRSVSELKEDKGYRVYRADFHSLTELELYLSGDPGVNERVFPSQKSIDMPEEFAGAPLKQAIAFCHGGYDKGFPLFMRIRKELESVNVKAQSFRRSEPAVVGSRPYIPGFLADTPKTMLRLTREKEKKFIDVYINLVYSGETSDEQIRNRGILVMNMISLFEQNHIGVNLYAFEASYLKNEIFIADIRLKRPGESLNIGKCYYPLCGKEFVRRLLVRVKESMPFREKWGVGYGRPLPEELLRRCLKIGEGKILIRSPQELGIKGENIYEDAECFFRELKLDDEIEVPGEVRSPQEKTENIRKRRT